MPAMNPSKEKWIVGMIIFIFLLAITIPYLYASNNSDASRVFGGFLLNPIDGNSYLAKMREGYQGQWLFTLPYTKDPGEGAALNLYYLFLGHVSRATGWSLIFTFHLARVIGALLLALALFHFLRRIFPEYQYRLVSFTLILFGSGLGWIAVGFGQFTSDFWVAEAYLFLASFANAHFPIGLALQIWLMTPSADSQQIPWQQGLLTFLAALILSVIYPFGWIVAVTIGLAWVVWSFWKRENNKAELTNWAWMLAGGVPYVLYSFWIVNIHPVLSKWNAQNLTPAPNLLDLMISFSPALILALVSIWLLLSRREVTSNGIQRLATWFIVGLLIVYLPFSLQRRLISGFYIPIAALAIFYVQTIRTIPLKKILVPILIIFSLPTNLLIIAGEIKAINDKDSAVFVYRDELAAFFWLEQNAAPDALVLASPDTGLLIPAYSSARVLYGHPFETVDADKRQSQVESFFSGELSLVEQANLLVTEGVDYVFYGPREMEIGPLPALEGWRIVFAQREVQILAPTNE
jgi:hypothetical protein